MHMISKPQPFSDFALFPETQHYFLLRKKLLVLFALCFFSCMDFFCLSCAFLIFCVVVSLPRSGASKLNVLFISLTFVLFMATCFFVCVLLFVLDLLSYRIQMATVLMRVKDRQKRAKVAFKKTFEHTFGAW